MKLTKEQQKTLNSMKDRLSTYLVQYQGKPLFKNIKQEMLVNMNAILHQYMEPRKCECKFVWNKWSLFKRIQWFVYRILFYSDLKFYREGIKEIEGMDTNIKEQLLELNKKHYYKWWMIDNPKTTIEVNYTVPTKKIDVEIS
jgi:hypothetical protein